MDSHSAQDDTRTTHKDGWNLSGYLREIMVISPVRTYPMDNLAAVCILSAAHGSNYKHPRISSADLSMTAAQLGETIMPFYRFLCKKGEAAPCSASSVQEWTRRRG